MGMWDSILLAYADRSEPGVCRRYAHWWAGLPGAEVRVLAS